MAWQMQDARSPSSMREPDSLFGGLATINEDSESGTVTNSPTGQSRACAGACEQGEQEEERGSPLHNTHPHLGNYKKD
jgi:hypothetical protein